MESSSVQEEEPEDHDVEEPEEPEKEEQEVEAENIGGAIEDTTSGDTKLY
jgi:hypothetical protein